MGETYMNHEKIVNNSALIRGISINEGNVFYRWIREGVILEKTGYISKAKDKGKLVKVVTKILDPKPGEVYVVALSYREEMGSYFRDTPRKDYLWPHPKFHGGTETFDPVEYLVTFVSRGESKRSDSYSFAGPWKSKVRIGSSRRASRRSGKSRRGRLK